MYQVSPARILICLLWAGLVTSQYDPVGREGTTENIQEVFTGRCWDYDITKYVDELPRVDTNCKDLWNMFFRSFSYRSPCDVALKNYDGYMEAAKQKLPKDKVMFWSGVFSLAHRYSDDAQRYVTLEDTLIGYLASYITWCGQVQEPGINMDKCPSWSDCPLEAAESFWAGASKTFASEASGAVHLMLDGSNPDKPAYRQTSFFGKFELPNLGRDVKSVNVIVNHVLDKPKLETCGSGSLLQLEQDVKARGLEYTCIDDPPAVKHLLCADDPESRECKLHCSHTDGDLSHLYNAPSQTPVINQMPDMF